MGDNVVLANSTTDMASELWRHPNLPATQMWAFMQRINQKYNLQLQAYEELYQWSIENIAQFWDETWHFTAVRAIKGFDLVRGFHASCDLKRKPPYTIFK
jgi:acetoacetyl-CoA synthetase